MKIVNEFVSMVRPLRIRGMERLFARHMTHEGTRTVGVDGRIKINADLSNRQQLQMFIGCFAREIQAWTRAIIRPGDNFLDVGANIGYLSLLAANRVGPRGRVISVEPYPPTFATLQRNIHDNHLANVDSHCLALSDAAGLLKLYVPPPDQHREYNVSCVPNEGYGLAEVPAKRLDHCLDEWKIDTIKLMKLDVEGAEPRVLMGGENALRSGRVMHLIIEINGHYLTRVGSSPQRLSEQLLDLGFRFARTPGGRGPIARISPPPLQDESNFDALLVHESVSA